MGPKELALRAQREGRASRVWGGRSADVDGQVDLAVSTTTALAKGRGFPVRGVGKVELRRVATSVVKLERPSAVTKKAGRGRPRGPERRPVLIELEPGLLERVDGFQERSGLGSRSEAIRALLERGLK